MVSPILGCRRVFRDISTRDPTSPVSKLGAAINDNPSVLLKEGEEEDGDLSNDALG